MLPRNGLRKEWLDRMHLFPEQLHDLPFLPQILPPSDIDESKLLGSVSEPEGIVIASPVT